jgi:hypothetical protein
VRLPTGADHARRLLSEWGDSTRLNLGGGAFATAAAFRLGKIEHAIDLMMRRVVVDDAAVLMRLDPIMHPLLDLEAFAPRRA